MVKLLSLTFHSYSKENIQPEHYKINTLFLLDNFGVQALESFITLLQCILQKSDTGQIAFFLGYLVFKNVKVKVKYGFVFYIGFAGPPFYFRIITSYLKMSGMLC